MSEDNEQKRRALEIYKILNDRVNHEIDELYTIHRVFLVIAGALIALTALKFGDGMLHLVAGLAGIVIAYFWYKCGTAQEKWKRWWIEETANVEDEIDSFSIWRKIVEDTSQTNNQDAKPKAESMNNNIKHPPPQVASVSSPMHVMPIIFGLASFASFIFGLISALPDP